MISIERLNELLERERLEKEKTSEVDPKHPLYWGVERVTGITRHNTKIELFQELILEASKSLVPSETIRQEP